jgi:hypothetical protein
MLPLRLWTALKHSVIKKPETHKIKADHANLQSVSVMNLCFMFLDREAAAWPHLAVTGKTHFCVVIT